MIHPANPQILNPDSYWDLVQTNTEQMRTKKNQKSPATPSCF